MNIHQEIRKHAGIAAYGLAGLGLFLMLLGLVVLPLVLLGTSLVAWRVSDERATAQDLDEIEKFANKKDQR